MDEKYWKDLFERDRKEKQEQLQGILKTDPGYVADGEFWDAHSCSRFADENGFCQYCGDIIYGSYAYRELCGGE